MYTSLLVACASVLSNVGLLVYSKPRYLANLELRMILFYVYCLCPYLVGRD